MINCKNGIKTDIEDWEVEVLPDIPVEPTAEDRLEALEEAMLALMGGIANV